MTNKYSNKKLQQLANADLIWVKKPEHYQKLLKQSVTNKGWDSTKISNGSQADDLVHDELWQDVCEVVNDLAQLVLEEREKRAKFLNELKDELKNTISNLNSKQFDKYY